MYVSKSLTEHLLQRFISTSEIYDKILSEINSAFYLLQVVLDIIRLELIIEPAKHWHSVAVNGDISPPITAILHTPLQVASVTRAEQTGQTY